MDFKEFAESNKQAVYEKICEYVTVKDPEAHYRIIRDYIDRQGKYRRPALLLLAACLYGSTVEDTILPAAAMQISEDWILMQDDWEDDSELRRGKPAAHRIYGPIHTVNASNTGQMAMWKMLKDYIILSGKKKGGRLYDKFYEMLVYTVEGQYVENHFIHDTKDLGKANDELYLRIVSSKTCFYTVYGPLQLGAIAGGAGSRGLNALKEIGEPAGVAFQIMDDVLDMTADEKVFGKKRFGDIYEGKITPIILHTYKSAADAEKSRLNSIYLKKREEKTADEVAYIRGLVEKYDGIGYAKRLAEHYGGKAKAALEANMDRFPNNEYRRMMVSAVEEMFVRSK